MTTLTTDHGIVSYPDQAASRGACGSGIRPFVQSVRTYLPTEVLCPLSGAFSGLLQVGSRIGASLLEVVATGGSVWAALFAVTPVPGVSPP